MFSRLKDARFQQLEARCDSMQREIRRLDDDLAQLRTQHERLRGRFYGARSSGSPPDQPPPGSRQEKDAILRDFLGAKRAHDSSTS